ncbi:MAG: hypothetical protein V8S74_06815 [Lachnospirales bacterium]
MLVCLRLFQEDLRIPDETTNPLVKKAGFDRLPSMIFLTVARVKFSVKEALDDLGVAVPVCGMVKDDHHRTRALLYKGEEEEADTHK